MMNIPTFKNIKEAERFINRNYHLTTMDSDDWVWSIPFIDTLDLTEPEDNANLFCGSAAMLVLGTRRKMSSMVSAAVNGNPFMFPSGVDPNGIHFDSPRLLDPLNINKYSKNGYSPWGLSLPAILYWCGDDVDFVLSFVPIWEEEEVE